jgi:nucleotidyltransferase substrate binding protein (TIGR01987 family)
MTQDIRWKQRFQNFQKAYRLLREALEGDWESLSDLEKQGVIQRFEFTFELAWKTLADYLEFSGVVLEQGTPRNVIKQGYAARILADAQTWIDMLEHRNILSHAYDMTVFEEAVRQIATRYLVVIGEFFRFLEERSAG